MAVQTLHQMQNEPQHQSKHESQSQPGQHMQREKYDQPQLQTLHKTQHSKQLHTHHNLYHQTPYALEFHELTKRYGNVQALDHISCTFPMGQVTALLGPNGAGKTTSIEIALGLDQPDEGFARVFGLKGREAIRRGLVGVVQQQNMLPEQTSVLEVLQLMSRVNGCQGKDLDDIISVTKIEPLLNRRVSKCSGGQQQRVRLAMSLTSHPSLLILDEPTVGMDVESRRDFWWFITDRANQGLTVVFATHYLAEAQDFADRAVIINRGKLLADNTISALRHQYAGFTLQALHNAHQAQVLETLRGCEEYQNWDVEVTSERVNITGSNVDSAAQALFQNVDIHHVTITESDLEAAYVALIAKEGEEHA